MDTLKSPMMLPSTQKQKCSNQLEKLLLFSQDFQQLLVKKELQILNVTQEVILF